MDFHGKKVAVIGAGSIGEALIRGWVKSEVVRPEQVTATAPRAASTCSLEIRARRLSFNRAIKLNVP